jgi:hypothetical protein
MPIDEWWEVVNMGVEDAKMCIEQGLPEETNANKFAAYVKFCTERRRQMRPKYTKIPMHKWNDPHHFDQKINVVMSY